MAAAYVNNATLLFATPLLGYAAAAAASVRLGWHSIAYSNEITKETVASSPVVVLTTVT